MGQGTRERDYLYDLYLSNLRIHRPGASRVVCPVCDREVAREECDRGHLFPAGSPDRGGTVIECLRCNSRLGTACEFHLTQLLRMARTGRGIQTADDTYKLMNRRTSGLMDGEPVRMSPKVRNGRLDIRIHGGRPGAPGEPVAFKLNSQPLSLWCAGAAMLHSALLAMFRFLGYEYVLHPNVQPIRRCLRMIADGDLSESLTEHLALPFVRAKIDPWRRPLEPFPMLIVAPAHLRAFMVTVPILADVAQPVLMPDFGEEGAAAYRTWLRGSVSSARLNLWTTRSVPVGRLADPSHSHDGRQLWDLARGATTD